jgi:hypothetical protein
VVATGTPEEVAGTPDSYTGRFLSGMVEPVEPAPKPRRARGRKRAPVAA